MSDTRRYDRGLSKLDSRLLDRHATVRRLLQKVIGEYARHNDHADMIARPSTAKARE